MHAMLGRLSEFNLLILQGGRKGQTPKTSLTFPWLQACEHICMGANTHTCVHVHTNIHTHTTYMYTHTKIIRELHVEKTYSIN